MSEKTFMSQETIEVQLTGNEKEDFLIFYLDDLKFPNGIQVNLNDVSGQGDLRNFFSNLLEIMVEKKIELKLKVSDGYTKGLYIDVCKEYVVDLNNEILKVYEELDELINKSKIN